MLPPQCWLLKYEHKLFHVQEDPKQLGKGEGELKYYRERRYQLDSEGEVGMRCGGGHGGGRKDIEGGWGCVSTSTMENLQHQP